MPADMLTNAPTLTDLAAEINAALRQADSTGFMPVGCCCRHGRFSRLAKRKAIPGAHGARRTSPTGATAISNGSWRSPGPADPAAALTKEREKPASAWPKSGRVR